MALIPIIAGLVGAGASFLKNRAANKSAKEQQQLYNEWVKARQAGVSDIFERATAAGFDPFGPQVTTRGGTTQQQTTTRQRTAQDITPTLTPEYKALESMWRGILEGRLAGPSALPAGYLGAAARGTNEAFRAAQVAAQNIAARRGLSGEQAVSIGEPIEVARAGKIADVANQIPLLERQLRGEDIQLAAQLAERFGKGQQVRGETFGTTTGFGTETGTATAPPNLGLLANLLLPPAPQAGRQTGISPAGGLAGDLATSLMGLWQGGAFGGGGGGGQPPILQLPAARRVGPQAPLPGTLPLGGQNLAYYAG